MSTKPCPRRNPGEVLSILVRHFMAQTRKTCSDTRARVYIEARGKRRTLTEDGSYLSFFSEPILVTARAPNDTLGAGPN